MFLCTIKFLYFILNILFIGLQISLGSKNPTTLLGNFIKQRLIDKTSKRFESIEKQGLTPHFSRATLLDPRCKKVAFGLEQNANDTEAVLITETATLIRNVSNAGKY